MKEFVLPSLFGQFLWGNNNPSGGKFAPSGGNDNPLEGMFAPNGGNNNPSGGGECLPQVGEIIIH